MTTILKSEECFNAANAGDAHFLNKSAHMLRWLVSKMADDVGAKAESPIERGMLIAFITLFAWNRMWRFEGQGARVIPYELPFEAVIYPQYQAGAYRLDFGICATYRGREQWFAVECDGAEFHNGTVAVARDKKRDRWLTANGYKIFRFTGSEIFNDPIKCACEVEQTILSLWADWAGSL